MGFDLYISLNLPLDSESGLPFIYDHDSSKKSYVPSEFIVPVMYRKWLRQKGHVFHYYIRTMDGTNSSSIDHFLDVYPEWDDIKNYMNLDGETEDSYNWSEKDHTEFKEALQWFSPKIYFDISWSF